MSAAPTPPAPSDQLLPVASRAQIRAHLALLMRGRWRWLVATLVVMLVDSALGLVGPIAIGWITQSIADRRAVSALVGPVCLLAVAAFAAAATGWVVIVLLARLVLPGVARLRERTVATAVTLPIDAVEAGGSGDLVSRVSGDVERVSDAAEGALASFVRSGLAILFTLVGLATLDWRFALAGLLAVPVQVHTLRWYLRTSGPIYAAGRLADGRRASALLAGFTTLPTLRALRLGGRQRDRIASASDQSMDCELRAIRAATRFYGRLNIAEFIGLGAILLVAFLLVRTDLAPIGAATTAALFFAGLFDPINTVLGVFDSIQQAGAGLARLVGIATLAPDSAMTGEIPAQAGRSVPVSKSGRSGLTVTGVRFGYGDGPDVLHDVSFRLRPGRQVAIVGPSGSGKSTLASLLAGLRRPRDGDIALEGDGDGGGAGRDDDLRRQVALVTQETHLFAGTIIDNVCLGSPATSAQAAAAALDAVGASGWIATLPNGVDTQVGGDGHPLAASQAQQIALARLLLLDPDLVVLDEATAEGGSDAARDLDRAAATVVEGRSAVIIAHRLSQTASADMILLMDDGRIAEHGSHEQLRAAGGAYAALWSAWSNPG